MAAPADFPEPDPEALFAPWAQARGVLLAVSGGPDSMALMLLAATWATAAPGRPPVFAATVDHGLRPEAAAEAQLVAAAAQKRAIPHAILPWTGAKPAAGVQEAARAARYELLVRHARSVGADVLMTAHHADDQAETVLFRLLRGSGLAGLAGMRAASPRGGLTLARPLLAMRKQQLVAICQAAGQSFADDPTNADPRYARTRLRRLLREIGDSDLGAPDWTKLAARLARADDALAQTAAIAAKNCLSTDPDGETRLDLGALMREPEEIGLRVLAIALESQFENLRENPKAAPALRLERLENAWERLRQAQRERAPLTLTLAGLQLNLDRTGALRMAPEPPRRRGRRS